MTTKKTMTEQTPDGEVVIASLAELAGGLGTKLEEIEGKPVIVIGMTFDRRQVRALRDDPENGIAEGDLEDREVVQLITKPLDPNAKDADEETVYYSFSKPLIAKLHAVPIESLPAAGIFERIDIKSGPAQGNRVWSISPVR